MPARSTTEEAHHPGDPRGIGRLETPLPIPTNPRLHRTLPPLTTQVVEPSATNPASPASPSLSLSGGFMCNTFVVGMMQVPPFSSGNKSIPIYSPRWEGRMGSFAPISRGASTTGKGERRRRRQRVAFCMGGSSDQPRPAPPARRLSNPLAAPSKNNSRGLPSIPPDRQTGTCLRTESPELKYPRMFCSYPRLAILLRTNFYGEQAWYV